MPKPKVSIPLLLSAFLLLGAACTRGSPYPVVDVHEHVNLDSVSLESLNEAMAGAKIKHMILVSEPEAVYDPAADFSKTVAQFSAGGGSTYKFLYGGTTLQPILHGIARPGATSVTLDELYPNGGGSAEKLALFQAVAADPTTYETTFKSLATASVTSGLYAGFGEMGAEHYSRKAGQPDVRYPVNHPLMMWLADLAAASSMPIDLHLEATTTTLIELSDLCAHNRSAKIIWDHAGWSNTGMATAETFSMMMAENPNLYLSLKLRPTESNEMREGSILDEQGLVKPAWAALLKDYSSRIMVGLDVKMGAGGKDDAASSLLVGVTPFSALFPQLPTDVATAISNLTAKAVYGF